MGMGELMEAQELRSPTGHTHRINQSVAEVTDDRINKSGTTFP